MTYNAIFKYITLFDMKTQWWSVCQSDSVPHLSLTMMRSCSRFLRTEKKYSKFKDPYPILILYFQWLEK